LAGVDVFGVDLPGVDAGGFFLLSAGRCVGLVPRPLFVTSVCSSGPPPDCWAITGAAAMAGDATTGVARVKVRADATAMESDLT
jgi:hypothetical protein